MKLNQRNSMFSSNRPEPIILTKDLCRLLIIVCQFHQPHKWLIIKQIIWEWTTAILTWIQHSTNKMEMRTLTKTFKTSTKSSTAWCRWWTSLLRASSQINSHSIRLRLLMLDWCKGFKWIIRIGPSLLSSLGRDTETRENREELEPQVEDLNLPHQAMTP